MSEIARPSPPPLVLIANAQEWFARSLESILGPDGYAVVRAHAGRQTIELARAARPDVVIIDAGLLDPDGLTVCRTLRDDPEFGPHIPLIVTTSQAPSRAARLEAYRAGAWDFCSQPLDGEELLIKLPTLVRAKREVDRIAAEALIDELTGLYNLQGLTRRARELGAEAARRRAPLACVVLAPTTVAPDLNEAQLEHLATTAARQLGDLLRRTGRVSDAIGRLGVSEFVVIAPATAGDGAARLIERVRVGLASAPLVLQPNARRLALRAAYCSVPNFADSSLDAVDLLLRTASALRDTKSDSYARRVTPSDGVTITFVQ